MSLLNDWRTISLSTLPVVPLSPSEQRALGAGPPAGWEWGHLTVSSQWATSPCKSLLKSYSLQWTGAWKPINKLQYCGLTSEWRVWARGQRAVQLCAFACVSACLDTVWMSNPVKRGVCLSGGGGVRKREHEATWRMESIQKCVEIVLIFHKR